MYLMFRKLTSGEFEKAVRQTISFEQSIVSRHDE